MPKVGKSSLIGAFLGAMSRGNSEYLEKQITSKAKPIISPVTAWLTFVVFNVTVPQGSGLNTPVLSYNVEEELEPG